MKGCPSGSYSSAVAGVLTTNICVVLLLLLMTKIMPWKGPDWTEMATLVFRDRMQSSGRTPSTLISAFLLHQPTLKGTNRASSGRLGAFFRTPSPNFDMK